MGYILTAMATGWLLKNADVFAFSGLVYPITTMARVRGWSDYKWDFTTSCWLALLNHTDKCPLSGTLPGGWHFGWILMSQIPGWRISGIWLGSFVWQSFCIQWLQSHNYLPHPRDCNLNTAHCTQQTAHYKLHTTNCTLQTAHYKLHTTHRVAKSNLHSGRSIFLNIFDIAKSFCFCA